MAANAPKLEQRLCPFLALDTCFYGDQCRWRHPQRETCSPTMSDSRKVSQAVSAHQGQFTGKQSPELLIRGAASNEAQQVIRSKDTSNNGPFNTRAVERKEVECLRVLSTPVVSTSISLKDEQPQKQLYKSCNPNIVPLGRASRLTSLRTKGTENPTGVSIKGRLGEQARKDEGVQNAVTSAPQSLPARDLKQHPPLRTPPSLNPTASVEATPNVMAPATPSERLESNGNNGVGPEPSVIQVAKPYIFEQKLQDCMTAIGASEAKEYNARLQGVLWIDGVRKTLQL